MAIFKTHKIENYSIINNEILQDKEISLEAKGLLIQMLSLPNDWKYSLSGLSSINKENTQKIGKIIKELKENQYVIVTKQFPNETKTGRYEYIYDIYETRQKNKISKTRSCFQGYCIQGLENDVLINKINNNKINKINNNIFKAPTIEEIEEYCKSRNNDVDPKKFYDYYSVNNWKDRDGKKLKNWKQKIITWEGRNKKEDTDLPSWFNKEIEEIKLSDDKKEEMDKLMEEFR